MSVSRDIIIDSSERSLTFSREDFHIFEVLCGPHTFQAHGSLVTLFAGRASLQILILEKPFVHSAKVPELVA